MENAGQDPAGQQAQADPQQAAADPQQAQGGSEGKDYKALYDVGGNLKMNISA